MWDNSTHMQKLRWAIGRWWFWVGLVILIPIAWYVWGYASWWLAGAKYRDINANAQAYIAEQEKQQTALEAAYKNDPYGGATPEATLKLFIEALEKKDYTLASNYFIPEKREESLKNMPEGVSSGGFTAVVQAYNKGQVKTSTVTNESEITIASSNQGAPYVFRLIQNPFTKKWLISDL